MKMVTFRAKLGTGYFEGIIRAKLNWVNLNTAIISKFINFFYNFVYICCKECKQWFF